MSDDLNQLETWIGDLYARLDAKHMSRVNRTVGTTLRRSQAQRIIAQQNPDGSQYAPRSNRRLRTKKGTIRRRKMFSRIRLNKYFINASNANEVTVGFRGRNAVIAAVHQYGESTKNFGRMIRMPKRELLGLTDQEIETIRDIYLSLLSGK
ncbi:phage virion morphogenesis protein [Pelistega sp. MC2]|uniref:phage virion morphogenesis protein n=1 Tax=Pelistega sp. MC2 TaxID=1720297 RepID=UPI0008DA1079|nr:phage virion morphogenesis protein [Pelistega sp. MC2]